SREPNLSIMTTSISVMKHSSDLLQFDSAWTECSFGPSPVMASRTRSSEPAAREEQLSTGDRDPIDVAACARDGGNDLLSAYDGTRVVRNVDVERGVHHLVRVIRRRVLNDGDVITEFGGIAHSRFDAGMRNESDDDELMDAVLLELQVQVGIGEAAGTP